MRERGNGRKLVPIDECKIVEEPIAQFMPELLDSIQEREPLRTKLYEVHFMTNYRGELLITLIYHKKVTEEVAAAARELREQFPFAHFILRKKGRKYLFDQNWLIDRLEVGGEQFFYKIVENTFTQPNRFINAKMVGWVLEQTTGMEGDLVELYCGHGNFTIPLAKLRFRRVVATEINRESVESALKNIELNGVENITFLALSSSQFAQLYREKSPLLSGYSLNTVLVDPPRAGLDPKTRQFVNLFDTIIYISCNPETLARDLELLSRGREIVGAALFDQFPYTPHIEAGVILKRSR
jgi:tRNA (uracil-5-)-methyltransferase